LTSLHCLPVIFRTAREDNIAPDGARGQHSTRRRVRTT
jgi:hypothetical protein